MSVPLRLTCCAIASIALFACESPTGQDVQSYAIEAQVADQALTDTANPLRAQAGDVVQLGVVGVTSDGARVAVPDGAKITWSGLAQMTADEDTPPGSMIESSGAEQALIVDNPLRFANTESTALVALLGPSSAQGTAIHATVSGVDHAGSLDVVINAEPSPAGDATHGHDLFVANCSSCHGTSGEGLDGPGLDANGDNMAGDPGWNSALFAVAARVDMDDEGFALEDDMPTWLTQPTNSGSLLTTQDFADMYAFLRTQTM